MMDELSILRLAGIISLVVLGIAALIVDGDLGQMLMVAVAGAVGVVIGFLFGRQVAVVEDEMEDH